MQKTSTAAFDRDEPSSFQRTHRYTPFAFCISVQRLRELREEGAQGGEKNTAEKRRTRDLTWISFNENKKKRKGKEERNKKKNEKEKIKQEGKKETIAPGCYLSSSLSLPPAFVLIRRHLGAE